MNETNAILCDAELMSGNTLVGIIQQSHVIPVCKELLPLCFTNGGDVTDWLKHRAMDRHRTNARLLKKVLRLKHKDDIGTALHFNAATITDNYWVRPAGSALRWEDVQFQVNDFSDLALMGKLSDFSKKPSRTPELTNIGSFEKCWRNENGAWWMYKAENDLERFFELSYRKNFMQWSLDAMEKDLQQQYSDTESNSRLFFDTFFELYRKFNIQYSNATTQEKALIDELTELIYERKKAERN